MPVHVSYSAGSRACNADSLGFQTPWKSSECQAGSSVCRQIPQSWLDDPVKLILSVIQYADVDQNGHGLGRRLNPSRMKKSESHADSIGFMSCLLMSADAPSLVIQKPHNMSGGRCDHHCSANGILKTERKEGWLGHEKGPAPPEGVAGVRGF